MYRPVLEFREDGIDHREEGYLGLISDLFASIRTLVEFLDETISKEAVLRSEEKK